MSDLKPITREGDGFIFDPRLPMVTALGRTVHISNSLSNGAEGEIYLLKERAKGKKKVLAKVFKNVKEGREGKIKALFADQQRATKSTGIADPTQPLVAYPIDIVYQGGTFVGYLMQYVDDELLRLDKFLNPKHFLNTCGEQACFGFAYLIAQRFAYTIQRLHNFGLVVADLTPRNFLITKRFWPVAIDIDSFQFTPKSEEGVYNASARTPNFLAPHHRAVVVQKEVVTPSFDSFALAYILFQLLMYGNSPFRLVPASPGKGKVNTNKAPEFLAFPHHSGACEKFNITIPPNTLHLSILPPRLQKLFKESFLPGGASKPLRPKRSISGEEWVDALQEAGSELRPCRRNTAHAYGSHLSSCPMCAIEDSSEGQAHFYQPSPCSIELEASAFLFA